MARLHPLGGPRVRHLGGAGRRLRGAGVALLVALSAGPLHAQSSSARISDSERVARAWDGLTEGKEGAREDLVEIHDGLAERHDGGEQGADLLAAWMQSAVILAGSGTSPEERTAYWGEAERAAAEIGDPEASAWVAWQRALSERDAGLFGAARERLEKALDSLGQKPSNLAPWILLDLVALARYRGAWAEALDLLDEVDRRLASLPSSPGLDQLRTACAGERGQTWIDLGLVERAIPWIQRESAGVEETGDPALRSAHLVHEANLDIALEDFDGVRRLVEEARSADPPLPAVHAAQLDVRSGWALSEQARTDPGLAAQAIAELERGLAEPGLLQSDRFSARVAEADLDLRGGAIEEAAAAVKAADDLVTSWRALDEIRPPITEVAELRALEARLALARGAGMPELVARRDALAAACDRFLAQWRDTPELTGGLGYLRFPDRLDVLAALVRLDLVTQPGEQGEDRALAAIARTQTLGTLARSLALPAPGVEDLRGLVRGPQHLVVAFLLAPSGSFVFWIGSDGIGHAELASSTILQARRLDSMAALAAGRAAGQEGTALVSALFPPELLARLEGVRALTLVGASQLGSLPIEAAPLPESLAERAGESFGERFALDHVPSFPLALELARRAGSPAPARLALVAATRPAAKAEERFAHLVDLPYGEGDSRAIAEPYAALPEAREPWIRVGDQADPACLRELGDVRPGVLHLLAHGVSDARRELPAALALHSDTGEGLVGCEDVAGLAPVPLVVLASCGAARGPRRPGEDGVENLGGAFLRAGSRCVVLSSFDLDDSTSRGLFVDFHRALARGASPAEALREARCALLARAPEKGRLGGLVHVLGCGQEPLFPDVREAGGHPLAATGGDPPPHAGATNPSPPPVAALASLALALLLGAFVLRRRRTERRPVS